MSEQRSDGNGPDDAARAPEFGAFATPEEQARRRGAPEGRAKDAASPRHPNDSAPGAPAWRAAPTMHGPGAQPGVDPGTSPGRNRRADRIVSYVLLALGFLNLVSSIPAYLSLQATLNTAYEQLGAERFDNPELAGAMGVAIVIVQSVIWVATFALTLTRIRAGKLSWWVPLVGALVTFVSLAVMLTIVMATDLPAMPTMS